MLNAFVHKNVVPLKKGAYAVEHGDYVGEFFVFMESLNNQHIFLSLPKMLIRKVPISSFNTGVRDKIIVFVENLPDGVYRVCCEQYKKNQLKDKTST